MRSTEEVLEFRRFLEHLSSFASSSPGRKKILELTPGTWEEAENIYRWVVELKKLKDEGRDFPLSGVEDITPILSSHLLSPHDALLIKKQIEIATCVRNSLGGSRLFEAFPLHPLEDLLSYIDKIVDEEGEIRDNASPELAGIRERMEKTRRTILSKLQDIMERKREAIQESVITERNERFVIPVKSSLRHMVRGMVVDRSRSGETVFVEPEGVIEDNNHLSMLIAEEREEIRRILSELTGRVRERRKELLENQKSLVELDTLLARVRYMEKSRGCIPVFCEDYGFVFKGVRNPVLELYRDVVPLEMEFGKNGKVLLISGPNGGGKTVLLKTVGLIYLLALSGIPVPGKEGTSLGKFKGIFVDIGDEQSMEEGVSTFTSHIRRITSILREASEGSLVLVDEIGRGTDPEEGEALAKALLSEFYEKNVYVIATTHLSGLKYWVEEKEGMENGSLEWGTFRFIPGIPGTSRGIDVARDEGLPSSIVERAMEFLDKRYVEVETLISELSQKLSRVKKKEEEVEELLERYRSLLKEYGEKKRELAKEKRRILREAEEEAREIVREGRSLIERAIREIKESQARKEVIKKVKKEVEEFVGKEEKKEERKVVPEERKVRISLPEVEHVPLEVDVRGMDREDAWDRVERFLDRALLAGYEKVRIIHGIGKGVLKDYIRKRLSGLSYVRGFYPEKGNDGATVVEL